MVTDAIAGGVRTQPAATRRRDGWGRRLPLMPAVLYVFVVTQIPFVLTVIYSLFDWNLLYPSETHFAGLHNYATAFSNPTFVTAIVNTVVLTASAVVGALVLGVLIALLLNHDIFGRGTLRTLMITPFLVMPTAAALIWKIFLLSPSFGLIDFVLTPVGLGRMDWVDTTPMAALVAIVVWQWTPFMMLIVLAGMQAQNLEVLEAARVDGAGSWSIFRHITLPFIRPYLELGALLGTLFILQTFDTIYMTTSGGPGTLTTNIPFLLYLVAFTGFDIGQASAIGVVAVAVTIIVATLTLRSLFSIFHVEARR